MLPGVTTGNYNRVFNVTVMGSNSNETTILTDGVSINNVRSGGSWLLSDFDGAAGSQHHDARRVGRIPGRGRRHHERRRQDGDQRFPRRRVGVLVPG